MTQEQQRIIELETNLGKLYDAVRALSAVVDQLYTTVTDRQVLDGIEPASATAH